MLHTPPGHPNPKRTSTKTNRLHFTCNVDALVVGVGIYKPSDSYLTTGSVDQPAQRAFWANRGRTRTVDKDIPEASLAHRPLTFVMLSECVVPEAVDATS